MNRTGEAATMWYDTLYLVMEQKEKKTTQSFSRFKRRWGDVRGNDNELNNKKKKRRNDIMNTTTEKEEDFLLWNAIKLLLDLCTGIGNERSMKSKVMSNENESE